MIRRMQAQSMLVDLAHASSATIADVLAISTKPVVVSHTGVKGTCNSTRNLSDDEIKGIAKTGGIIGIGYWPEAVGSNDARAIGRAMRYTAGLVGVEHVALGSDFDGACSAPFDAAGLAAVTQALIDQEFSDEEIRLIMGGNAIKLLKQGFPKQQSADRAGASASSYLPAVSRTESAARRDGLQAVTTRSFHQQQV